VTTQTIETMRARIVRDALADLGPATGSALRRHPRLVQWNADVLNAALAQALGDGSIRVLLTGELEATP
jgi:hypothetical protein